MKSFKELMIRRVLLKQIPGTYLAEYREDYKDGHFEIATRSWLWHDKPGDLVFEIPPCLPY